MSTLAELKQRLEAARVERERRDRETREQEEQELQRMAEEERRQEEEGRERVEEGQVAEGQRNATDVGGEGSMETGDTAGVTETAGEGWEADIARLHTAAMAGGEEEYQATEDTCWNCRHRKLVCERPE